jgi:hypothetical protein
LADFFLELGLDSGPLESDLDKVKQTARRKGGEAGNNFGNEFSKSGSAGFKKLGVAAAAAGAAIVGALFSRAAIRGAIENQDAINGLNVALLNVGKFSEQTSKSLSDFADQIERSSRFTAENALDQVKYALSLNATEEQTKNLITASTDLSAALGTSLESGVQRLSRTLSGDLSPRLAKIVPELKGLTEEQLRSGLAIDIVSKKFAGFSEKTLQTFSGQALQAKREFGALTDEIGFLVIKNPAVIQAIELIRAGLVSVTGIIKDNSGAIINLSIDVLRFAISVAVSVDKVLRSAFDGITPVIAAFGSFFSTIDNSAGGLFKGVLLSFGLFKDGLVNGFNAIKTIALAVFIDIADAINIIPGFNIDTTALNESLDNAVLKTDESSLAVRERITALLDAESYETERSVSDLFIEEIGLINQALSENAEGGGPFSSVFAAFSEENLQAITDRLAVFSGNLGLNVAETANALQASESIFDNFFEKLKKGFESVSVQSKITAKDVANSIVQGIGGAAAAGFSAFGAALVQGENALKAFTKAFLQSIGQAAVQLGTRFILEGVAISFNPFLGGPAVGGPLIGAGAALATFGGALGAIGGSGGAGGASGGVASPIGTADDGIISPSSDFARTEEEERRTDQSIQVVIQGDVYDSEETGSRILKALTDNFKNTNSALVDARLA